MKNQVSAQNTMDELLQVEILDSSALLQEQEANELDEHSTSIHDIHLQTLYEQPTTTTSTTNSTTDTTQINTITESIEQVLEHNDDALEIHDDEEEEDDDDEEEGEGLEEEQHFHQHQEPLHDLNNDESLSNSPLKDGQSTPSLAQKHPIQQQPTPISNMPSPRSLQAQIIGQIDGLDPLAEPRQLTEEEMQHQQMMMAQQFYYPMHQQQMFMPRYPYPEYSAIHPGIHPAAYAPYPAIMRHGMYPHTPMRATRQQPEGPKRTRTILSEEVVEYLNREFKANKFPPPQQRDAIATALNLSPKIVSSKSKHLNPSFFNHY